MCQVLPSPFWGWVWEAMSGVAEIRFIASIKCWGTLEKDSKHIRLSLRVLGRNNLTEIETEAKLAGLVLI